MKRWSMGALVVIAAAGFWACGGGKDNPTQPPDDGTTGGLTQESAQQFLQDVESGDLPLSPISPGKMVGFVAGGAGKIPAQACSVTWSGDLTDNDQDGVAVNAYTEVNCDTTLTYPPADTFRDVLRGRVQVRDNDDNDPWVGRVEFSGVGGTGAFEIIRERRGTVSYTFLLQLEGFVEATHQNNTFAENMDIRMYMHQVEGAQGDTLDLTYRGTVSFTPTDPAWNPGREDTPLDGTLTIDATWVYGNAGTLTITTPTPLELRADCQGDPVSGTLKVVDPAGNTLEITWTACGQYTATYNGTALPPAL